MKKTKPKFKAGDRCVFVYGDKHGIEMELDDNMVVKGKPRFEEGMWWYDIKGKANPCEEKFLRPHVSMKKKIEKLQRDVNENYDKLGPEKIKRISDKLGDIIERTDKFIKELKNKKRK